MSSVGTFIIIFIILLAVLIISMNIYRKPYKNPASCDRSNINLSIAWNIKNKLSVNRKIIDFSDSMSFTREKFMEYITSSGKLTGESPGTIIKINNHEEIIFNLEKNVHIIVDLEDNGRFLLNNGGTFTLSGESNSSITFKNGLAPDEGDKHSSGGCIRHVSGFFNIIGTDLFIDNCRAGFGGGAYFISGEVNLSDNLDNLPGRLYFKNCRGLTRAGGSMSIWEATVSIISDNGTIECVGGSTPHHAGNFIMFYGELILRGKYASLITKDGKSGKSGSIFSYSGNLQFGENFPPYFLTMDPTIRFIGEKSSIQAIGGKSGSTSGAYILRAQIYNDSPFAGFKIINNQVTNNKFPTIQAECAIEIKDCCTHSKFALPIYIDGNIMYDGNKGVDVYISDRVNNIIPVNVTGNGTMNVIKY